MTFSSAVRLANRRMFWKVRAMPARATMRAARSGETAPANRNAAVGLVEPGEHVEQRGLAGAVRGRSGRRSRRA